MHAAILVFDGFDDLDAVGPFEVFGHARSAGAHLEVGLYAPEPGPVTSSHGMSVRPDGTLETGPEGTVRTRAGDSETETADATEQPDLVVVPGGGWNDRSETGARAQVERGTLPDALASLHADGTTVASVCTGGMVLAAAGLLDGRPAVTHHGALDDLRETDAVVREARVVDDGDIVTAGGVTAGLDLALHLVEREFGQALATQVAETMAYERRGEVAVESPADG